MLQLFALAGFWHSPALLHLATSSNKFGAKLWQGAKGALLWRSPLQRKHFSLRGKLRSPHLRKVGANLWKQTETTRVAHTHTGRQRSRGKQHTMIPETDVFFHCDPCKLSKGPPYQSSQLSNNSCLVKPHYRTCKMTSNTTCDWHLL